MLDRECRYKTSKREHNGRPSTNDQPTEMLRLSEPSVNIFQPAARAPQPSKKTSFNYIKDSVPRRER